MRLTQLEIFGFKSFAEKIVVPFHPGITAIVGPNGCGKSNVVEAIRWVLGEQRAGAFRSHKMEEVIFSGTNNRKALGMSEVALTIENNENVLAIDYKEVALTRRLFRSGESDYLLNRIPCRLLDITNLLMDTGLGQGAYSVMEQGMIDEIVSEKTDNRRRILEEAAGITKYKTRRRSTWNRLEATQADLTRIEDIISEVKRQVDYLQRQVGRARKYQEQKQELDNNEILLGRHKFFKIRAELVPLEAELAEINKNSESKHTEFTAREASLEKSRLTVTNAEHQLQETGRNLNNKIEQIHEDEQELAISQERKDAAENVVERTEREMTDYTKQIEQFSRQYKENEVNVQLTKQELIEIDQRLKKQEETTKEIDVAFHNLREQTESLQQKRMNTLSLRNECNLKLERSQTEQTALLQNRTTFENESISLSAELSDMHKQLEGFERELATNRAKIGKLDFQRQEIFELSKTIDQYISKLTIEYSKTNAEFASIEARRQALQKLRSGYEGYTSGVRTLMLESPIASNLNGVLGDQIEVNPIYVTAVEAALGEAINAIISRDKRTAFEAINYLKENEARAGIYTLDWPRQNRQIRTIPPKAGLKGSLTSFLRIDPPFSELINNLLSSTYLVDTLDTAFSITQEINIEGLRFVTLTGEILDSSGYIAGGKANDEETSVLGRRREITNLDETLSKLRKDLIKIENRKKNQIRRLDIVAKTLGQIDINLQEHRELERDGTHGRQSTMSAIDRIDLRLKHLQSEQSQIDEHNYKMTSTIADLRDELADLDKQGNELEYQIEQSEKQQHKMEIERQQAQNQRSSFQIEQAKVAASVRNSIQNSDRLNDLVNNTQKNIERLNTERSSAEENIGILLDQIDQIGSSVKSLHEEREQLVVTQNECREKWSELNSQNRAIEEEIGKMQRSLNAGRERSHKIELRISELGSQTKILRERLQEEQGCNVEDLGIPSEEIDAETLEKRIESLRQSINRLGSIHLGVLEEYDEQKERYDFLVQQRDDLTIAADDLRKTLSLIDRTARSMFVETFDKIREKFQETYARFFEGGEADLKLEEGIDPLEASIEISARPRGKQLQSIALLSGGERALTAISLLFAIYLVKPSPFCILDEVDAPLDDSNISRFVRVLKEFARKTQFIVVTHNKLTMAAADTLHGVTMPEEGISQLVSVRVEDSEEFVEAAG